MKSYLLCAVVQFALVSHGSSSVNQQSKNDSLLFDKLGNVSIQLESNKELLEKIELQQKNLTYLLAEETDMDSPFFRNIRGLLMVDRFSSGGKWSLLKTGMMSILDSASTSYEQLKNLSGGDSLPMDDIVHENYTQLLEVLIDYGLYVDTTASSSGNDTFLHLAAWYNRAGLVQLLLKRKANISARNSDGNTPLILAAYRDSLDALKMLVNHSADINVANDDGDTGLHLAAQKGFMDVVRYLVDSGANATLVDNSNFTAEDLAAKAGHKEIAAFLSSFNSASYAHRKKSLREI